ncbi:hypothetical protein J6590_075469 [Homalodisca vitripennis]|nr:hypothetical protein J6590_075469 [Homalodisca vitripennis]
MKTARCAVYSKLVGCSQPSTAPPYRSKSYFVIDSTYSAAMLVAPAVPCKCAVVPLAVPSDRPLQTFLLRSKMDGRDGNRDVQTERPKIPAQVTAKRTFLGLTVVVTWEVFLSTCSQLKNILRFAQKILRTRLKTTRL